ncbi:MAG: hypothetical protein J1E98_09625 [Lachnospiraceae bacterium]|nr:hypothetical protein [Lachnospiraceae bacterium]
MKKKTIIKIFSILAAATLFMTQVSYTVVYAVESEAESETEAETESTVIPESEKEVIYISSAEELSDVSAKCNNDQWSSDKRIELTEDIALSGSDFEPFKIFAGTFNGNGHTISGFRHKGSGYADGFFRYITVTGIVQDLAITGIVESENEKDCTGGLCGINGGWILNCTFSGKVEGKSETGGLVGENESSGTINNCSVSGTVTGYDRAGGISGANYGAIRNCVNKAGINSDSSWLEEKDEAGLEWLLEDVTERKLVSGTDIGGIAGYSKGIIANCNNAGVVGYEHNGYNIGGIAGRQSGRVSSCNNTGSVYGRKDVGGIVGQMEPYISVEEAESISEAVQRLHNLIDKFLDDASATQDDVSADFDGLRSHADMALSDADSIAGQTTDFIDKNITAVNEVGSRIRYIMERLPYIIGDINNAIGKSKKVADDLQKVVDALKVLENAEGETYDETKYARLSLVPGVGGNVYADKSEPAEGEEVRITVTPDEGYRLAYLTAMDAGKNNVALTEVESGYEGSNEYTFVMPAENVVVKAEFAAVDTNSLFVKYVEDGTDTADETDTSNMTGVSDELDVTDVSEGSNVSDVSDEPNMTDASDMKIIVESNPGGKADYSVSGTAVTLTVRPNSGYTVENVPTVTDVAGSSITVSGQGADSYIYTFDTEGAQSPVKVRITFSPQSDSATIGDSWSDLRKNISLLQTRMQNISDTMDKINKLMDGKNIDDFTSEDISNLLSYMVELAQELSDAGTTLSYVLSDLSTLVEIMTPYIEEALKNAGVEMDSLVKDLKEVFSYLDSAFGLLRSTILYLNGKFDIQFAKLGDGMSTSIHSLFDELGEISSYAARINNDINRHSDVLDADLHAINDQINIIFQLFVQKIEDVEDLYFEESGYEDVSDEDIDENSDGKVDRSVNSGIVKGDINVGGIAGSMAIDEEDPEGNAAGSVHYSFGSRYLTKCIIDRCKNDGKITAKKDGVGGIAGYMNLGIITDSEAYGSAESTDGEYIGGISGESLALIRNCYSLASLKGLGYIGGIVGSGKKIQDCYSMALIDEDTIRKGAIAGWIETKEDERLDYGEDIKGNFFVSDDLSGIDSVSYIGIAEPVTYKEILEMTGVPTQFRHLQLTFIANDVVVERMEVEYGKPLSEIELPDAPHIDGSYAKWPDITNMKMSSNITLEAEYYDNITTLPSQEVIVSKDEDSDKTTDKPYAFIDGIFTDDTDLDVIVTEKSAQETKAEIGKNAKSVIYEITVKNGDLSDEAISKVRIYNPYEKVKAVMDQSNGRFEDISYKEYGKYIQVEMKGDNGIYRIVSGKDDYTLIICIAGGAILLLVVVTIAIRRHKDT